MKPKIRGLSHDHIDGCRFLTRFIEDFYIKAGLENEFKTTFQSHEKWLAFMRDSSLTIYERFNTITKVLQSKEVLKELGRAYVIYRAGQGYTYFEGTIAPQVLTLGGLNMKEAAAAVYDGIQEGKKQSGLNLIVRPKFGIVRDFGRDGSIDVAKIAADYGGEAILDLVGTEPGNPPGDFLDAYNFANENNVPTAVHIEWVKKDPLTTYWERLLTNFETAVFVLKTKSADHSPCLGYALDHRPDLIKYIVDHQIRIPMCPLSNLTLSHIDSLYQLRIKELLDAGVWVTLNPDDDLFLPDMKEVVEKCDIQFDFTRKQATQLEINAVRAL